MLLTNGDDIILPKQLPLQQLSEIYGFWKSRDSIWKQVGSLSENYDAMYWYNLRVNSSWLAAIGMMLLLGDDVGDITGDACDGCWECL